MSFFGPGWPNFDPFFKNCLQITSKYAQKILKLRKISLSEKKFKSEKLQKWPKKRQKNCRFFPGGTKFAKIKKRLGNSLTFTPERLYTKFQTIWLFRLGENALRTDKWTDGRMGMKS